MERDGLGGQRADRAKVDDIALQFGCLARERRRRANRADRAAGRIRDVARAQRLGKPPRST